MRKLIKNNISIVILVVIVFCITIVPAIIHIFTGTKLQTDIDYKEFEKNEMLTSRFLVSGTKMIEAGGSDFSLIYYNLETGYSGPFCTNSSCSHDGSDCSAKYGGESSLFASYFYDGNLFAVGSGGNNIFIYKSNQQGTDKMVVNKINYRGIDIRDIIVRDNMLYIIGGKIIGSSSEAGNGFGSEEEGRIVVCSYDMKTNEYEKLFESKEGYQPSGEIVSVGKDYLVVMDCSLSEPLFGNYVDVNTGEILVDNMADCYNYTLSVVDLKTLEVSELDSEGIRTNIIGEKDGVTYVAEYDSDYLFNGTISGYDFSKGEKEQVSTIELNNAYAIDPYFVTMLEDGFAVPDKTEYNASYSYKIYDINGKLLETADNCPGFIMCKAGGRYLLWDSVRYLGTVKVEDLADVENKFVEFTPWRG